MDKWQQMTIFDFLEPIENGKYKPDDDFDTMTIQRAAELIGEKTGIKFKLDERHFKECYSGKHKGFEISIYFSHYLTGVRDGRRFLDVGMSKGTWGCGRPSESIEEAIQAINKEINKCQYSGHSCNKQELWKIAETLDDPFCPHVCCRNCATKGCGARCNGSEEPKDKVKCNKASECEAYPDGCGGSIENCKNGPYKWTRKEVEVKGIMDDGYCPNCGGCIVKDLADKCNYCGQLLSWEHWKEVNEE